MLHDEGFSHSEGPDTAPLIAAGDAYRDLRRLLPDTPSFSRILRRMMQEAQGRVVSAEERAEKRSKRELRNHYRKRARRGRQGLAVHILTAA